MLMRERKRETKRERGGGSLESRVNLFLFKQLRNAKRNKKYTTIEIVTLP